MLNDTDKTELDIDSFKKINVEKSILALSAEFIKKH